LYLAISVAVAIFDDAVAVRSDEYFSAVAVRFNAALVAVAPFEIAVKVSGGRRVSVGVFVGVFVLVDVGFFVKVDVGVKVDVLVGTCVSDGTIDGAC
jgi:hypothetical protein